MFSIHLACVHPQICRAVLEEMHAVHPDAIDVKGTHGMNVFMLMFMNKRRNKISENGICFLLDKVPSIVYEKDSPGFMALHTIHMQNNQVTSSGEIALNVLGASLEAAKQKGLPKSAPIMAVDILLRRRLMSWRWSDVCRGRKSFRLSLLRLKSRQILLHEIAVFGRKLPSHTLRKMRDMEAVKQA